MERKLKVGVDCGMRFWIRCSESEVMGGNDPSKRQRVSADA